MIILQNKKYLLEQFEIMNSDDFESKNGLFKSFFSKTIDNLQITINNLYVRYEDSACFNEPFTIGITLKEAKMFTCNEM